MAVQNLAIKSHSYSITLSTIIIITHFHLVLVEDVVVIVLSSDAENGSLAHNVSS